MPSKHGNMVLYLIEDTWLMFEPKMLPLGGRGCWVPYLYTQGSNLPASVSGMRADVVPQTLLNSSFLYS